ncbi:MAG: diguanylate cyclase [Chitinophagales bacterium]|nr:diguanylate cyclase [Chitinophagales bacterium]
MEMKLYSEMLRRNWWMILLTTLVALNASLIASYLTTPQFTSSTRFVVSPNLGILSGRDMITSMEALDKRSIVQTYSEFLNSRRIFEETIVVLGINEIIAEEYSVSTVVLPDTNILELTVSGPNPETVALLANGIGKHAIDTISLLYTAYDINVLDPAMPATTPFTPQPTRNATLAMLLGLVGGAALAIISEQIRIPIETYRKRLRIDTVTGVYNIRYFKQLLSEKLLSTPLDHLSVGIIDLGGLQEIIKTIPPLAVQNLLRSITDILQRELRGNDVIGRWDETSYIVLLPTTTGEAAARTFERIYHALKEPLELGQYGISVLLEPAVGGAVYSNAINATELLDQAEKALKTARQDQEKPVYLWQMKSPFWLVNE